MFSRGCCLLVVIPDLPSVAHRLKDAVVRLAHRQWVTILLLEYSFVPSRFVSSANGKSLR